MAPPLLPSGGKLLAPFQPLQATQGWCAAMRASRLFFFFFFKSAPGARRFPVSHITRVTLNRGPRTIHVFCTYFGVGGWLAGQ
jgi:hypothetical protein